MKITRFNLSAPLLLGAGCVLLAPLAGPVLRAFSRNIAKAMVISGVKAYRMVAATSMAASETVIELYEEARAELAEPNA